MGLHLVDAHQALSHVQATLFDDLLGGVTGVALHQDLLHRQKSGGLAPLTLLSAHDLHHQQGPYQQKQQHHRQHDGCAEDQQTPAPAPTGQLTGLLDSLRSLLFHTHPFLFSVWYCLSTDGRPHGG